MDFVFDIRRVREHTRLAIAAKRHRVDRLSVRPEDDEPAIGRPLIQRRGLVERDERLLLSTDEILHEHGWHARCE